MNEEQLPETVEAPTAAPESRPRATTTERHILSGSLFRARARRVTFSTKPVPEPAATPEPVRRPAKVARMLALAHHIQAAIDRDEVADRATVARRLGLTRARVCQLLDLCLLAPDIQEEILGLEAVDGAEPMAERALREVFHAGCWAQQFEAWSDAKRRTATHGDRIGKNAGSASDRVDADIG